jgi:hypothetical protein
MKALMADIKMFELPGAISSSRVATLSHQQ